MGVYEKQRYCNNNVVFDDDGEGKKYCSSIENNNNNNNINNNGVVKSSSSSSSSSSSLVGRIDPVARAMNTIQFGLIVHFGTMWIINRAMTNSSSDSSSRSTTNTDGASILSGNIDIMNNNNNNTDLRQYSYDCDNNDHEFFPWLWLWWLSLLCVVRNTLLLHEYWVYLQHFNVLANPLCQRLDRQYGIALLKTNQHWAIAGTLSAYWCRESMCMFLCLPFLSSSSSSPISTTTYFVLYSLIYHTVKSHGIRLDALNRYSSTFGIMRIVIDKFYHHTIAEKMISIGRLLLQGFDTYIHAIIIIQLYLYCHSHTIISTAAINNSNTATISTMMMLHIVFIIWVIHAALNQYFRKSTASLVVKAWCALTSDNKNKKGGNKTTNIIDGMSSSKIKNETVVVRSNNNSTTTNNDSSCNDDNDEEEDDDDDKTESTTTTTTLEETESEHGSLVALKNRSTDSSSSSSSSSSGIGSEKCDNTTTDDDDGEDYIVRSLLRPGRVSNALKGTRGAVSNGVDTAVKIEKVIAILAAVYIIGFRDVPFKILAIVDTINSNNTSSSSSSSSSSLQQNMMLLLRISITYGWILVTILRSISLVVFLTKNKKDSNNKKKNKLEQEKHHRRKKRKYLLLYTLDVMMVVIGTFSITKNNNNNTNNNDNESGNNNDNNNNDKMFAILLGTIITIKSFLYSEAGTNTKTRGQKRPFRYLMNIIELFIRIQLGRFIVQQQQQQEPFFMAFVGAIISLLWGFFTVSSSSSEEEVDYNKQQQKTEQKELAAAAPADVVFLGHPVELSDFWALWLLPYPLDKRWERPWWTLLLWPIHYILGYYSCVWRRQLYGDGASFYYCDRTKFSGIAMETWTSVHFARHFLTHKREVQQNIEATARHANHTGVKILCLGALNKSESINGGGIGVVHALGPHRKLSIVHGNHLTAAAVVETTQQCFGTQHDTKVFLTGASSKVGWAVAQALRDRFGYDVLCHSSDRTRRKMFQQNGFKAATTLLEGIVHSPLWIVGKYDTDVARCMPQGGTAIVFSVPHPLQHRHDVRVIEAGMLHMDLSRFDHTNNNNNNNNNSVNGNDDDDSDSPPPRKFCNKLECHEIFACNAAGIVAAHLLKHKKKEMRAMKKKQQQQQKIQNHSMMIQQQQQQKESNKEDDDNDDDSVLLDETGPVDPSVMDMWLETAKELGFRVPSILQPAVMNHFDATTTTSTTSIPTVPRDLSHFLNTCRLDPVVVIGAGPSGLAVASSLRRRGIKCIILEKQMNHDAFGSWDNHFSNLEITTQKHWCNLPGFPLRDNDKVPFPAVAVPSSSSSSRRGKEDEGEFENHKASNNTTITAKEYGRYLSLYAKRFGIEIKRGYCLKSVRRGGVAATRKEKNETFVDNDVSSSSLSSSPWVVECECQKQVRDGDITDGNNDNDDDDEKKTSSRSVFLRASAVVIATGKARIPQRDTSDHVGARLMKAGVKVVHSTDLKIDETWEQAIHAAKQGRLCVVGFGNSASDICTAILMQSSSSNAGTGKNNDSNGSSIQSNHAHTTNTKNDFPNQNNAMIHLSARTIPPVFPRKYGPFRVDTVGSVLRNMPSSIQEVSVRLLWRFLIPDSIECDKLFPKHLSRWSKINGRVPVIDKLGQISSALRSGIMVGHGPIRKIIINKKNNSNSNNTQKEEEEERKGIVDLVFDDGVIVTAADGSHNAASRVVSVDMVIMATGYKKEDDTINIGGQQENRLNGLYKAGFGNDQFLPLKSIGEEAESIATEIADKLSYYHNHKV